MQRNRRKRNLRQLIHDVTEYITDRWPFQAYALSIAGLVACFIGMVGVYKDLMEYGGTEYLEIVRFVMK